MDYLRLKQFPSVAANAEATLVTDELLDRSVYGLIFERGGTAFTNAHISSLMVRLDGKEVVPSGLTGAQLVDLNEYDGIADVANYTAFYFGDPTARTIRGQHQGDLDLSVYRKPLEIKVNIGAATDPTLQVYALCGVPKAQMGVGFSPVEVATFRALTRTTIQPNAAVTRSSYGISLGSAPGARIRKLGFFHTNLTKVELKKQSLLKWDDISIANNSAVEQHHARTPQAGLYMLDRVFDGNQGEAEMTVQQDGKPWNLQVNLTTSAGDTIPTYADIFTTHPQL
jgi:hypothetical protein